MREISVETEREIATLVRDGHKLQAVKAYKLATGASLVAAKQAVESMIREQPPLSLGPGEVSQQDQVLDAIFRNEKLNAVKLYRQASGASLKESKEFVEALTAELRAEDPEQFRSNSAGCAGTLLLCLLLIGAALAV